SSDLYYGSVSNSFWDTQTTGQATAFGVDNSSPYYLSSNPVGMNTADFFAQANFDTATVANGNVNAMWDFTNTWWMIEGNTRPMLRSEYSTTIASPHQLQMIGMDATTLAASYTLAENLNMAEITSAGGMWNTATGFVPLGNSTTPFSGLFDGANRTISNLNINRTGVDYVGLFGANSGTISNLGLVNGSVSGNLYVGVLAGMNSGTISNSFSTGTASGTGDVGGLMGWNSGGAISDSYSTGNVASGTGNGGGLLGRSNGGTVTNSYSAGMVSGSGIVGGLIGANLTAVVANSYWNTATSGQPTSSGGTGLTTVQMQSMASFTGWNIANTGGAGMTWRIYEGQSAPLLASYLTPLTVSVSGSRTYNATTDVSSLVTYSISPNSNLMGMAVANTSSPNVGTYNVTPSGLYSNQAGYDISYASGSVTINQANLTLLSLTANNASKSYGTTLNFAGTEFTPVGLVGGDLISSVTLTSSGAVNTANVGSYAITPSNAVFSVGSAGNYDITYVNGILTVTPKALSISGSAVVNRAYNGTTTANITAGSLIGLVGSDTLGVSGAGTFADKNAGTAKQVTTTYTLSNGSGLASNYSLAGEVLTGDITPVALSIDSISGSTVVSRSYNGTTDATVTPGTLVGMVGNETLGVSASGTFADKNVGTAKQVATTYALSNGSGLAGNYTLNGEVLTGDITPATLTVLAVSGNKVLGTSDPLLRYIVTGYYDPVSTILSGSLERDAGEVIGNYAILQGSLFVMSSNYTMDFVPGSFSILAPTVVQEITQNTVDAGSGTTPTTDEEEEKKKAEQLAQEESLAQQETNKLAEQLPICR
ncbi:MAG: YDG domain-containing protein, partial [Sideroxydans sp.]|nr:YDG domain-containing protein [Sideroxydans sp.]